MAARYSIPEALFRRKQPMAPSRVDTLNEFAGPKHPGMVGVEILNCEPQAVTGQLVVGTKLVAGTGFLWAPVVITLADWLCAAGTPCTFPMAPPPLAGATSPLVAEGA